MLGDRIVIYQGTDTEEDPSIVLHIDYNNLAVELVMGDQRIDMHRDELARAIEALQDARERLSEGP